MPRLLALEKGLLSLLPSSSPRLSSRAVAKDRGQVTCTWSHRDLRPKSTNSFLQGLRNCRGAGTTRRRQRLAGGTSGGHRQDYYPDSICRPAQRSMLISSSPPFFKGLTEIVAHFPNYRMFAFSSTCPRFHSTCHLPVTTSYKKGLSPSRSLFDPCRAHLKVSAAAIGPRAKH